MNQKCVSEKDTHFLRLFFLVFKKSLEFYRILIYILCFDSIFTQPVVLCLQIRRIQSNHGNRGIVGPGGRTAFQNSGRNLPKRFLGCGHTAPQGILSAHTVAEQCQHLSPTQGQSQYRLPAFRYGNPGRRAGCPDFFISVVCQQVAGSGAPL